MRTALRKMGNSTGLIVPKALLAEMGLGVGTAMKLRIEGGELVASPVRKARDGWEEDAARIGAVELTEEEQEWMNFGNEGDDELEW